MNSSSKSKFASSELSGARDPMIHGLGATAKADLGSALGSTHPLETSECEYEQTEQVRQLENLRQMQGLHAPLRIHMERNALSKVTGNLFLKEFVAENRDPGFTLAVSPKRENISQRLCFVKLDYIRTDTKANLGGPVIYRIGTELAQTSLFCPHSPKISHT